MREIVKSFLQLSWATSLFGVRQLTNGSGVAESFDRIAAAASANLPGARPAAPPPNQPAPPRPQSPPQPAPSGRLNVARFVVLGEGLAAGMGNFTLASDSQQFSFPAQMARQMGTPLPQPLIEPPGIGDAIGFDKLPVIVPNPLQTTVLDRIPPERPANLSVPGFTVADALHLRPRQPLIDRHDSKQTCANLILGMHAFAYGTAGPMPTQLESALTRRPTFALIALGYAEALEAAASGALASLPARDAFRDHYRKIVHELRAAGAEVVALTVPDPTQTAHFAGLDAAARTVKVDSPTLAELWRIGAGDLVSVNGLNQIAFDILNGTIQPLSPDFILPTAKAAALRARIHDWNREIVDIAKAEGARVFNLACYIKNLHENGVSAAGRTLTADYLGGFYTLNGYYPGATGHALIANELLGFLNREFGAAFPPIDLTGVMSSDPSAGSRPAAGPNWTRAQLDQRRGARADRAPLPAPPPPPDPPAKRRLPLRLPDGLEQVLPINPAISYFGDGIAALQCTTPQTIAFGSGGNLIFGGLAMVDSHLTGNIRIRFSPPVNGCTQFQLGLEGGLSGDDQVLAAPRFFKMPFRQNRVTDIPGFISSGTLNLETGDVETNKGALNVFAQYSSSALNALVALNPSFPVPPAAPLSFPGQYGSACMVFEQRPDGKLDLTFSGTTFVPLGNNIVWPLNFVGPSNQYATIPANGTVLHPHLALSTKQSAPATAHAPAPNIDVPTNAVREYTLFAPISSFGDVFSLQADQLGGPATGRSRLLGRVQIQFGPRCGSLVPVAIATSTAGGILAPTDPTPLTQLFPGRLTPGPEGFYENLSFPLRSYSLNDLAIVDDPFDISVGAIDVRTGRLVHPLLHRGFINQDLIFALIRVEPCTPQNSFMFRGPGEFRGPGAGTFQYYGQVHIPYPPGFLFPDPNLATGFPIGPNSALDPYLWFWAFEDDRKSTFERSGDGEHISTRGERFTFRYSIAARPDGHTGAFEYVNQSQKGSFKMHSLAWAGLGKTIADGAAEFEVLTFTGFGVWSKDGIERVEEAAVQICASDRLRYVGIQIGRADVSNVNTPMPPDAFPVHKPEPGGYVCCIGLPSQPPPPPPPPRPCPQPPPCGARM